MSTAIGTDAPTFTLPDTDSGEHGVGGDEFSPATLVVFTCNHCPYALAWHDRIQDVVRDYTDRDVVVAQVVSNDAELQPLDSLEAIDGRRLRPRVIQSSR